MVALIIDGREWLLNQGVKAFTYFTGMKPPLETMRKALHQTGPIRKSNIALIGFMGVGKSTVGHLVAERLKMPLVDIDNEIEKKNGLPLVKYLSAWEKRRFGKWKHDRSRMSHRGRNR